jgi:glycine/betaine/sarcosine/D-proline reductase family selenoprotein B
MAWRLEPSALPFNRSWVIPAVTGMSEESVGLYRDALLYRRFQHQRCQERDVLVKMADLGKKLVNKSAIGLPTEEGYLRRGLLRDQVVEQPAAKRLNDMLVAKVKGEPFESEMLPTSFESVPMPFGGSINEKRIVGFALERRLPSVYTRIEA